MQNYEEVIIIISKDSKYKKNKNYKGNGKEKKEDMYKSSSLLLEHMAKEYDKEDARSAKIESRIPIFITIATFFGAYIFNEDSKNFKKFFELGQGLYTIYTIVYFICIVSLIIAIVIFGLILSTKKYRRIESKIFLAEEVNKEEINKTAFELMKGYQESLENNIIINDNKVKLYNNAIRILSVSAISYLIIKILNIILL